MTAFTITVRDGVLMYIVVSEERGRRGCERGSQMTIEGTDQLGAKGFH